MTQSRTFVPRLSRFFLSVSLCLCGSKVGAETSYPMVMCVQPVAVQAGQTTECEVMARYDLQGTYKVFVSGEGVTGSVEAPKAPPKPGGPKQIGRAHV